MAIHIARKDVGPKGIALRVITTWENKFPGKRFKIDVWTQSGKYRMRLEGLGYRRLWEANTLKPLLKRLKCLHEFDAAREAIQTQSTMEKVDLL